ncbi:MAG: GDSL-type esterase/lipase family protein [Aliiglaciecola sp.]|uniref:GDSL-type esterase/lipase family protein n=1 Tax=Aliiglaciecola sp. TaxID=1872441 RepID=UPI003296FEC3
MKKEVFFDDPRFAVMGRTLSTNKSLELSYPGVSVHFNVSAKSVQLVAHSPHGKGRIDVVVNNKLAKILVVSKTPKPFYLIKAKQAKLNKIELINRGESWHGIISLKSLILESGDLLETPSLPSKKLLFVGDSITSGALMERPASTSNTRKGPHLSNARQSFGMLLGRMLNAQVHLIAYGGRGLLQGSDTSVRLPQLPQIFPLTIPETPYNHRWPIDAYIPDGIFICLGTNDFYNDIPNIDLFNQHYTDWIEHLLSLYPNTQIMISEGPMLSNSLENKLKKHCLNQCLLTIVKQVNHPQLHHVPCINCEGDEFDPHPTIDQHLAIATHFSPLFADILNW